MGQNPLEFNQPSGIVVNSTHILVSDSSNHRLQVIDHAGSNSIIIGSMGNELGKFSNPTSVAFDEFGNMYVVDQGNNRIQKLSSAGIFVDEISSSIDSRFDGYMNQILLSIPNLHADAIENSPSGEHIFIGDWTSGNKTIFKSYHQNQFLFQGEDHYQLFPCLCWIQTEAYPKHRMNLISTLLKIYPCLCKASEQVYRVIVLLQL